MSQAATIAAPRETAGATALAGVNVPKFGMWTFLASEVMFFTGLIGTYIVFHMSNSQAFEHDAAHLNWIIGAFNTLVLITSSLTMVLALAAAQHGDEGGLRKFLAITASLGLAFLVIKFTLEYVPKFHDGHMPWSSVFYACYFTMTGVHAAHVFGGILPLTYFLLRSRNGRYLNERSGTIELMGLYWHFVDVVWIFLFPLLYLVG